MLEIKYDLMAKKKLWFIISLIIIVPGLISLAFQGLNLGIDFTGGNLWHLKFADATETQAVRKVLEQFDLEGSNIQAVNSEEFIIRTVVVNQETSDAVMSSFKAELGQFEILRNDLVGPVIGKELAAKAIYALLIAAVFMIIYITYRFELSFALAAILAIMHDVFVTLGIFSILQIETSGAFVAAVLTVIGYSINATIVIFDRIRENLKYQKGGTLANLVNHSVWQTMTRSINTSLTVIFVLVPMLLFGGETIAEFVLALLIGVISGVYSSVLIASPLWLEIKAWEKKNKRIAGRTPF